MYVTVGLPVTKKWYGRVYFVPLDRSKPRSIVSCVRLYLSPVVLT